MTHCVQAIVAKAEVLQGFSDQYPEARVVALPQGVALVPVTSSLLGKVAQQDTVEPGFAFLSTALAERLADLSNDGPVAYIETEYFGGTGTQAAVVWNQGTVHIDPVEFDDELADVTVPLAERPINRALAALGVERTEGAVDLFDSVGMGNHRSTDAWATRA